MPQLRASSYSEAFAFSMTAAPSPVCQRRGSRNLLTLIHLPPPPGPLKTADPAKVDLRIRPDSKAVDAGIPLPGLNDGFAGKAPDLGCVEAGQPAPVYGPRPR